MASQNLAENDQQVISRVGLRHAGPGSAEAGCTVHLYGKGPVPRGGVI